MTVRFVSAVDGNNANGGTSWADAKQTVAGALAIAAAGDFIKVDSAGTFTAGATITWTLPAGPIAIVSVNRAGSDAWLAGAVEAVGAANAQFNVNNAAASSVFVFGMTLNSGTTAGSIFISSVVTINCRAEFWSCTFDLKGAVTSAHVSLGATASAGQRGNVILLRDCSFKCAASRVGTYGNISHATVDIINPTFNMGGATKPAILWSQTAAGDPGSLTIRDGDITGYAVAGGALFDAASMTLLTVLLTNLKTSATPTLTTGSWVAASTGSITQRNVDSGNTLYVFQYNNFAGTLTESVTVYAAGGASFNGAGVSWQVVTTAACNESFPFTLPGMTIWNTATTSQTATVEFIRDSATNLTNRDIWMDFGYAASASFPNYTSSESTRNANPFIGTPVDQSSSATSWTGTGGFSNPNAQKLTNSFTAAAVGLLECIVSVAATSATIYVDPKIKVT